MRLYFIFMTDTHKYLYRHFTERLFGHRERHVPLGLARARRPADQVRRRRLLQGGLQQRPGQGPGPGEGHGHRGGREHGGRRWRSHLRRNPTELEEVRRVAFVFNNCDRKLQNICW